MFGMANGGTEFLRMPYPQQSAHMGSRLQLIDAQGHTQSFTDELVVSRAATLMSVCQDRYEAMVKDRTSRDASQATDLRQLRTSLRRTIRLYANSVMGMLDEQNPDSPLEVHRALYPIVAAVPTARRAQVNAAADETEAPVDAAAPVADGEPGPESEGGPLVE
jgi:hypothetical protein